MPLLTTTQVRAIIRAYGGDPAYIYTNKTAGHTGKIRRVKTYYNDNQPMLVALILACGEENVTLTNGSELPNSKFYQSGDRGVTVKCTLG